MAGGRFTAAYPEFTAGSSRRTTRPRLSRDALEDSAVTWYTIGVIFLVLAAAGSIIMGIAFAPEKAGGLYSDSETDSAVGVAIGVGFFAGSLITILPYFMFSRVMKALADLMPPTPSEAAPTSAPSTASPANDAPTSDLTSDVTDYPEVAAAYPGTYQTGWEQLVACNPQPDNPEAWLRELCGRIDAGAPAEMAAQRIPLNWR